MTVATHRPDLRFPSVLQLALAYAVAINGLILTPFLVSAVMQRFGLDEGGATQIAGIEIIGIAISCALLPRWIARAAGAFTGIGVAGVLAGQLASALAPSVAVMCAARGVAGLFEGMLFVVVAAGVAHRASTDKLWGLINLIAGAVNGCLLVAVSFLPADELSKWLFFTLVGLIALGAPVIRGIGTHANRPGAMRKSAARPSVPLKHVLSLWVVTLLIYGVQASEWAVAGIVGSHAALSASTIGILLSLSSLIGFAGAIVPSCRGSHRHRLAIILAAQAVMVLSTLAFFASTDRVTYFVSQVTLNVSLFIVIPFLTGMLSEVDPDGSLVSRTVVVTFIGAGVGTALAGGQFAHFGSTHFAYAMCVGILAAVPFVWHVFRKTRKQDSSARTTSASSRRASATSPR
jgi:predicted MFS family arabinose efflux permease